MATSATNSDERWLAERLVRAERAVRDRQLAGVTRARAAAVAAALGLAVVGLLLPWSREDGAVRDAFSYSAGLVVLTLLTAAGGAVTLLAYVAAPGTRRGIAVRSVIGAGGAMSMIAGLVVSHQVEAEFRQWWGLGLFEVAMATAIGLAVAVIDVEEPTTWISSTRSAPASLDELRAGLLGTVRGHAQKPVRPGRAGLAAATRPGLAAATRPGLAGLGIGGIGLAAVGLTSSWQRLSGAVVERLVGHPLVWRGTELADTHALRWTIAVGLAAALATTAARPIRWLLPLVLAAAGAIVIARTVDVTAGIPVRGTSATISVDAGAWLTLAGGIVATVSGLALGLASWRIGRTRTGSAAAVAVVAVLATVAGGLVIAQPRPAGADTTFGAPVLGALEQTTGRLGVPADTATYASTDLGGVTDAPEAPAVARSLDGTPGTWFLRSLDRRDYLIEEIVQGRALPVTEVYGAESVDLLGVVDGRAVLAGNDGLRGFVDVVDLRAPSSRLGGDLDSDTELPTTVLTTVYSGETRPRPGAVVAKDLDVQLVADGSAVVTARQEGGQQQPFLVDAVTVRGTRPWALITKLPVPRTRLPLYGPGGTAYSPTPSYRVSGAQGLTRDGRVVPVLGGVSDQHCALSRDPLSSSLTGYDAVALPGWAAMDRAGNLWLVVTRPDKQTGLYIVGADGVLRRMPPGPRSVRGLRIAGDGSLFVVTRIGKDGHGPAFRIADPPAAARQATPLPAVSPGCVSDNRVTVSTAGRTAVRRGTVPGLEQSAVWEASTVAANGTVVRSGRPDSVGTGAAWTLSRQVPGRPARTVYRTTAQIDDLAPDGRGGAWWLQIEPNPSNPDADGPSSIGHVDAAGQARIVAHRVVPAADRPADRAGLAADPHDGSVWWGGGPSAWHRTTVDGRTAATRYQGGSPIFGGGTGYVAGGDIVSRMSTTGLGAAVLGSSKGRKLLLPSAVAAHVALTDFSAEGEVNTTSDGRLLLYQGGYLARITGDKVEVLSGPADGLPREDDVRSSFVLGDQLVLTVYPGQIFTVDVS